MKRFKDHKLVKFGEVNLDTDYIKTIGGTIIGGAVGVSKALGWPAILYYNEDTGLAGKPYNKGGILRVELSGEKKMVAFIL